MNAENDIVSALTEFDLEKTDAMLYLSLLQTGPSTVNTISTKLNIDKGKIYRSLHKLQNLGLVSATFSNPTICHAVEPEKALTAIIQRKEEQIISMQKILKKLVKEIDQVKNPHDGASQLPSFYIIQGRPNVYNRIGKLLQESANVVYIVTTIDDVMRMNYTAIYDKIKMCKNNGGQVRLITNETSDYKILSEIDGIESTEVRIGKLPSKSRLIVSKERLLMSGSMNESMSLNDEVDSALYTNSHEIIENMFSFCTHLWGISKPLELVHLSNSNGDRLDGA